MAADVGTGITIVFGTSGFAGELLSVNGTGISRPVVPTTHLATTTALTFMPGDLYDPGGLDLEIAFDLDDSLTDYTHLPPYDQAAETVTITFPVPAGLTNGATVAGTAFCSDFSYGVPLEDRMTASFTMKYSGALTWVDAT